MIPEDEYTTRLNELLNQGIDPREAPTRVVLNYGLQHNLISSDEADYALSTLRSFLLSHPGYLFLSPREKEDIKRRVGKIDDKDEKQMWAKIQPILNKARNTGGPEEPSPPVHLPQGYPI